MDVGIITFNSAHNFGATLQTYAMQRALEKKGFNPKIIDYRYKRIDNVYNPFKRKKKGFFDFGFYMNRIKLHTTNKYKISRYHKYEEFFIENLNLSKKYASVNSLRNEEWEFDAFICGSDQIWNAKISRGLNPSYFLDFAPKDSIKIVYSASTGSSEIERCDGPVFKYYFRNLDSISLRESDAVNVLQKFTDKNIEVTLDPTLLLKKEDYDHLIDKSYYKDKDFIFVYVIDYNEELYKIAAKISKDERLPIIISTPYLTPKKIFKNQIDALDIGPKEFLGLIHNAKYVVTNSYHGNIFSILYKKIFISTPHYITSSRVLELFKVLGIDSPLFFDSNDFKSIRDIKIDYNRVYEKLNVLREFSFNYLENALKETSFKNENGLNNSNLNDYYYTGFNNDTYIDTNDKFTCYGCYACNEICHNNAISMIEDKEGFEYPKIDKSLCDNCKSCRNVCIYRNEYLIEKSHPNNQKIYVGYNRDLDIRLTSSSGGIFNLIAEHMIENDYYVVGASYDENMDLKHVISSNKYEVKNFSGFKDVRVDIWNIFPKIKNILDKGDKLVFSGVSCQISGLKSFLEETKTNCENLVLIEILCQSNSSPKVFKKYIEYLEKKYNSNIIDFKFKDTSNSGKHSLFVEFENGEFIRKSLKKNEYMVALNSGLLSRPSCFDCIYNCGKFIGDLTIGSYSGVGELYSKKDVKKGVSTLIVNNDKGNKIFNTISDKLIYRGPILSLNQNYKNKMNLKRKRYELFDKIDGMSIDNLLCACIRKKKSIPRNIKK